MKVLFFAIACLIYLIAGCGENNWIFITNPVDGTMVNGVVEITFEPAVIHSERCIVIYIDDSLVATIDSDPYAYTWDTKEYAHGSAHTIKGMLFDSNHYHINTSTIEVTVYKHRAVLAEAFVQSNSCGFDILAEKALTDSLVKYQDTMVVVFYHINGTYSNEYSTQREMYYSTGLSTPYVIFDGVNVVWEPNPGLYHEVYERQFLAARDTLPYFTLEVEGNASSVGSTMNIRAIALQNIHPGDIQIFAAILEDSLLSNYGYHNRVCRFIIEIAKKTGITYPDTINTHVSFKHNISLDKMSAAVFIQNTSTKQIMQSAIVRFQ